MGQFKLGQPDNILSPKVIRFSKADADGLVRAKAANPSGADVQPLELSKAHTKDLADQIPPIGWPTFSSGFRALVAVVVFVALLPNLIFGALLWLGMTNSPWSREVTLAPNESLGPAVQSAIPPAVLSAPTTLEATAGEGVTFPIALDGTDGVPARSIIAISGLPQGSALSSGHPYGETEWNLKSDEIGDLRLVLPKTASGEAKLLIQLVAPDGAVIADTAMILKMTADPRANVGGSNIKTELAEAHVLDQRTQRLGVMGAAPAGDSVPLPSRRPASTANNDVRGNWIKPLSFTNLREGPSPSAHVVSVVPKGTKLRVLGRKNRCVQVTFPRTSERGWIYAGNVATVR